MEDEDEENLLPDETQDGPTWVMAGVGMDGPRDDFFRLLLCDWARFM